MRMEQLTEMSAIFTNVFDCYRFLEEFEMVQATDS